MRNYRITKAAFVLAAAMYLLPQQAQAGSAASATYFAGSGGKFDSYECTTTLTLGVNVTGLLPTHSAVLTVYGYDVDEEQGEINHVSVNGNFAGKMSGANNIWNATTFILNPAWLVQGNNVITYRIDINSAGWCSQVDWIQLLVDGGSGEHAYIDNMTVDQWQVSGSNVSVTSKIEVVGRTAGQYRVEANLIDPNGNNVQSLNQTFDLAVDERSLRTFAFAYPLNSITGTYRVNANLYQGSTFVQQSFYPFEFYHTVNQGVNLPPVVSKVGDQTVFKDRSLALAFTVSDNETAASALVASATSSNSSVVPTANLVFSGSGGNRVLTITPLPGILGTTFVTLTVSDGAVTSTRSFYVTVVDPANSAPVLNSAAAPVFTSVAQNSVAHSGNTIAEVVVVGSITDADGVAPSAITIINVDNANGSWEYSLDDGLSWNIIVASTANALPLAPEHRVRFMPANDYTGSATITFVAWDMTSANAAESVDASTRGGITPFSAVSDTASVTVRNAGSLNTAPVLDASANPALSAIVVNNTTGPGSTVAEIVTDGSITDADGPIAESIAVFTVDDSQGAWQYSLDNGNTWQLFGAVTSSNARLLAAAHRIRFVPNVGFSGVAQFAFRAWDRSTGVAGGIASVASNGLDTPFSSASDNASIQVLVANTAPVLDDGALHSMTPILEGNVTSAGNTAADIIKDGSVTDANGTAVQAMAVIGADTTNGIWQYSVDGLLWTDFASVSEASALLLDSTYRIRFVPNAQFFGTADFSFVAWDRSAGAAGERVNAATRGGTTAFSLVSDTALIIVKEKNDAPTFIAPTPSGVIAVADGELVVFSLAATDPDSTDLEFGVSPLPVSALFEDQVFSWTPTYRDAGEHVLVLLVTDGYLTSEREITVLVTPTDTDGDGLPDAWEEEWETDPLLADTNGNGIADGDEVGTDLDTPRDTDGDGTIDALDDDADGDGILDIDEIDDPANPTDHDGDGLPDYRDNDRDNDGKLDGVDTCPAGELNWISSPTTDHDNDGCQDSGEDTDDDNDGVPDVSDDCVKGTLSWTSNASTDHDSDGCQDASEDNDDDNDGVLDSQDASPKGETGWTSNSETDHDGDGSRDATEDLDDDDDGVLDEHDACAEGELKWTSDGETDHDADGCLDDSSEDLDDDNDGVLDEHDTSPKGETGWTSDANTDRDGDGQRDASEDLDDDNDGVLDEDDACAAGELNWTSSLIADHDGDGCQDESEDLDDDNDGVEDEFDACATGETAWIASNTSDHDNDGCQDASEDNDDDNDGVLDDNDDCARGEATWSATSVTDHDGDGCLDDSSEDLDDDNDGVLDTDDGEPRGETGWTSSPETDRDGDGRRDAGEDLDDDNDGVLDVIDLCVAGELNWEADVTTDHDGDGCQDASEDLDDDNDGVLDDDDAAPRGETGWIATDITDRDHDGRRDDGEDLDDDNDGVPDSEDAFPYDAGETFDNDGDGVGDIADLDDDNDGVSDVEEETVYGTNPKNADSDGDGVSDGDEVLLYGTNPTLVDSDDDGLSDADEILVHGTDPLNADTDGDGLSDGSELDLFGTDPLATDSDGDGISDDEELAQGLDPTIPEQEPATFGAAFQLAGGGCNATGRGASELWLLIAPLALMWVRRIRK